MAQLRILVVLVAFTALAEVRGNSFESHLLGSQDATDKTRNTFNVVITQKWFLWKEYNVGTGALINNYWVITSAEVAKQVQSTWYQIGWSPKVKAGVKRMDQNPVHQVIGIKEVVIHEFYSGKQSDNDIALIKLQDPGFVFNDMVGSVVLPDIGQDPTSGQEVMVTGWLAAGKDKKPLQELVVPVMDKESCAKAFGTKDDKMDDTLFCTENTAEKAVCVDDLGAPATVDNGDSSLLVGIFTMTEKPGKNEMCGTKPALFTNIAYYSGWVKAHLGLDLQPK